METSCAGLMSKATESENSESSRVQRDTTYGRTWLDIPHGLLGSRNVIAGGGFGMILTDVLNRLFGGNVSLDDACGNSKIGGLLCDGLAETCSVPLD